MRFSAFAVHGPVTALLRFMRGLAEIPGERLEPGDIVTIGAVACALPIRLGEVWSSAIVGTRLPGLTLACVGGHSRGCHFVF